ncbi:methylated-DNA--[protein]-cysteine S-methyltransferase [Paracoccus sp. (in: a-proteobacteria)]|uniref:methylated-DNA--[protein]-cysteine S-methyltransferase n=1 Tax=Paracoccus sp. TaxID=267 RepID=UPI0035B14F3E
MPAAPDPHLRLQELLGHAPQAPDGAPWLLAAWFDTPLGEMICVAGENRLHLLEFVERKVLAAEMRRLSRAMRGRIGIGRTALTDRTEAGLAAYFAGTRAEFDLPLAPLGTGFQQKVWAELVRVPAGLRLSYGELAQRIGRPSAVRAVARANGANPIAVVIPCHRILGADGALTGYGGGLWRKRALLDHEDAHFGAPAGQSAP